MTIDDLLTLKIKVDKEEVILAFNSINTRFNFYIWINADHTLDSGVYTKNGLKNYKANIQNLI